MARPVTCACGRHFPTRLGFGRHAESCPDERRRVDAYLKQIEPQSQPGHR